MILTGNLTPTEVFNIHDTAEFCIELPCRLRTTWAMFVPLLRSLFPLMGVFETGDSRPALLRSWTDESSESASGSSGVFEE